MFAANLAFQQRDVALIVSFCFEIITERPPLKCFYYTESYFFFLAVEAIMIDRTEKETRGPPAPCNALWE